MADKRLGLIKIEFNDMKAYAVDMLFRIANFPLIVIAAYLLWKTILQNTQIEGITLAYITTYYVVSQAVSWMTFSDVAFRMSDDISEGGISTKLTRPISYIYYRFWTSVPRFLLNSVIFAFVIIISGFIFPLQITKDPLMILLFIFSTAMGFLMSFSMFFIIGLTALWLQDNWGLIRVVDKFSDFFAGAWIPLQLLPVFFKDLSFAMPFRFMVQFPTSIMMGTATNAEITTGFIAMAAWTLVFLIIASIAWKIGEKKIIGFGV